MHWTPPWMNWFCLHRFGSVVSVEEQLLSWSLESGHIPIICSVGETSDGQLVPLNSLGVTAHIAKIMQPLKVMFLNNSGGLRDSNQKVSKTFICALYTCYVSIFYKRQLTKLLWNVYIYFGPKVELPISFSFNIWEDGMGLIRYGIPSTFDLISQSGQFIWHQHEPFPPHCYQCYKLLVLLLPTGDKKTFSALTALVAVTMLFPKPVSELISAWTIFSNLTYFTPPTSISKTQYWEFFPRRTLRCR